MTVCPVALAVGCKKCPAFNICPAKAVIGDHPAKTTPDPLSPTAKKKRAR